MTAPYHPQLYDVVTPATFGGDVDWYRREAVASGGPVLELAYLYPPDIRRLLRDAGFEDVTISGGFGGGDFARDTDELVVEAAVPRA